MKVYYISGYNKSSGKPKYAKAYIQQYHPMEVIECKTEDDKIIFLYKQEYILQKK